MATKTAVSIPGSPFVEAKTNDWDGPMPPKRGGGAGRTSRYQLVFEEIAKMKSPKKVVEFAIPTDLDYPATNLASYIYKETIRRKIPVMITAVADEKAGLIRVFYRGARDPNAPTRKRTPKAAG